MQNQSGKGNYNPNLVWINKIPKRFLYVYTAKIIVFFNNVSVDKISMFISIILISLATDSENDNKSLSLFIYNELNI